MSILKVVKKEKALSLNPHMCTDKGLSQAAGASLSRAPGAGTSRRWSERDARASSPACNLVRAKGLAAQMLRSQSWEKSQTTCRGGDTARMHPHTLLTVIQACTQLHVCGINS